MGLLKDAQIDLYTDLRYEEGYSHFEAREITKHMNDARPDNCSECGAELESEGGYVGEEILYCPRGHGIKWEDSEDIIRRII